MIRLKLPAETQEEVRKALDQQLSELGIFDTTKYALQSAKRHVIAARLAALTKLNNELERLTRKVQS
jgi:hypothetical protein